MGYTSSHHQPPIRIYRAAYRFRIQHFVVWCFAYFSDLPMPERVYPTEAKVVVYLKECVMNQKKKSKDNPEAVIGTTSVKTHVYAIAWYWNFLLTMKKCITEERYPNILEGKQLKSMLTSHMKGKVKRRKQSLHTHMYYIISTETSNRRVLNREDPLKGSYCDNLLSQEHYQKIMDYCYGNSVEIVREGTSKKRRVITDPWIKLQAGSMILMERAFLARGQITRGATLACFHYIRLRFGSVEAASDNEVENVGLKDGSSDSRRLRALSLVFHQGKTNGKGKIEQAALIRHKDPLFCPLGMLALYWFYTWEILENPSPQIDAKRDWYKLMAFPATPENPTDPLKYEQHVQRETPAYNACGHAGTLRTHAGRHQALTLDSLTNEEKANAGRWNQSAMHVHYESFTSKAACLEFAGFGKGDEHYIARDILEVPDDLQTMIFPWVDALLDKIQAVRERRERGEDVSDSEIDDGLAARSFLLLVRWMRVIIIQDSVFLMRRYPRHQLWLHDLFTCESYKEYAAKQLEVTRAASVDDPNTNRLDKVAPHISSTIRTWGQEIHTKMNSIESTLGEKFESLQSSVSHHMATVNRDLGTIHRSIMQPMVMQRVSSSSDFLASSSSNIDLTGLSRLNFSTHRMVEEGGEQPRGAMNTSEDTEEGRSPADVEGEFLRVPLEAEPLPDLSQKYECISHYAKEWYEGKHARRHCINCISTYIIRFCV